MTSGKTSWAKGREPQVTIAVKPSTRDFAKEVAYQERLTVKELIELAVAEYAKKRSLKIAI